MNINHGPATWKNKDTDQPINVIGYLGKKDGKHYVKIEGSSTGVPLDEIDFGKNKPTGYGKYNLTPDAKPNGGGHKYHNVDMNKVFGGGSSIKPTHVPTKVTKIVEAQDKTTRKIVGKIVKPHNFNIRGWQKKKIENALAEKAANWAAKTVEWGNFGRIGAAAVIGTAAIIDSYNNAQDKHLALKQQRIQERNVEKRLAREDEDKYIGMGELPTQQGLVQNLFNNRIGHTNTWGGRKY